MRSWELKGLFWLIVTFISYELFVPFCLALVSSAMFSPNFISIMRSPFLFSLFVNTFLLVYCTLFFSLLHLTFRLTWSALFPTMFDFCGNSQPFFSSLSDFYITVSSFLFDCFFSISDLFVPFSISLLCYHFLHLWTVLITL